MGILNGSVIFVWILFISTVQGIREGHNATKNQFPYHAHIDVFKLTRKIGDCSGALVSQRFVITSYRCVMLGESFRIRLGSLNPGNDDDDPAYDNYTTKRIYSPKEVITSTSLTKYNYVALLELESSIRFNDYMRGVNLPIKAMQRLGSSVTATGYYSDGTQHLQWLNMVVVPMSECATHFHEDLLEDSLCVRGQDIDGNARGSLCKEESVPIIFSQGEDKVLMGLLKKHDESCENGGVNLFIDITPFFYWINDTISAVSSGLAIHNANQNELPYYAHIEVFVSTNSNRNNCSGGVITSLFVITAHSCVWDGISFNVKLGFFNTGQAAYYQRTDIRPLPHPDNIGHQGIALLKMQIEIPFNYRIQPFTLPGKSFRHDDHYAIAMGFFSRRLNRWKQLQWINMKVLKSLQCNGKFRANFLSKSLCVQPQPRITFKDRGNLCNGIGVPLVYNNDRKTLLGILEAPQVNCRTGGRKSLFIDVYQYIDWIRETTGLRKNVVQN